MTVYSPPVGQRLQTLFCLGQRERKSSFPEERRKNKSKRCTSRFETAEERTAQKEREQIGVREQREGREKRLAG